ncbi:hypothetical protein ACQRD4_03240 [Streptococcus hyointestinalis]|nr:hypothetical protein [Streptococcus hyointestinalis]MCI6870882.1 hypothetical protein [Streptococcus hyointestinalis]MDD6385269.1 hypothetical protein [Streptococcus hyointestinalis]MDD7357008.1 hypothetical protein [Streptococcus hyointestinalis]MDY4552993.1 hypothetical protein [Streptococcus hyointestinalis]
MMSRYWVTFLSAAIFMGYGLLAGKVVFFILGLVFAVIGIADYVTSKK